MPHQCTNCGRTFPDGSKEMLSGCPDCGGNKFQFRPAGANTASTSGGSDAPERSDDTGRADDPEAGREAAEPDAMDRPWPDTARPDDAAPSADAARSEATNPAETTGESAGETRADDPSVSGGDPTDRDRGETPADRDHEDRAQASARSDVVSPGEIAAAGGPSEAGHEPEVPPPEEEERPGLAELRAELNSQFESIKILSPGTYELNLMELYDREEYIISLQEDGRYVIEVPDTWRDDAGRE